MPRRVACTLPLHEQRRAVDVAAGVLGPASVAVLYRDLHEFTAGIAAGGDAVLYIRLVLSSRVTWRRYTDVDLVSQLQGESRPRWVRDAIGVAFGMYCVVRRAASPRGVIQPMMGVDQSASVSRAVRRAVGQVGIIF